MSSHLPLPPTSSRINRLSNAVKFFVSCVILISYWVFFLIICVPLYLNRFVISRLHPYIRSDLSQMLTPQSSIMATDTIYSRPECSFVVKLELAGKVSKSTLEKRLESAVCKEEFIQLTQTLGKWMGYYFWKLYEPNHPFLLQNHLEYHEESVTLEELQEIHTNLVDRPFKRYQPLWECVVYTHVKCTPSNNKTNASEPSQTAVFFRIHQSLVDGTLFFNIFSELKMLSENHFVLQMLVNNILQLPREEKQKLAFRVCTIGFYNIVREWVDRKFSRKAQSAKDVQNTIFKSKQAIRRVTHEMYLENLRKISVQNFAQPFALVLSILRGAIRRVIVQDEKLDEGKVVPSRSTLTMNVQMPIPLATDRLSNFVAYVPIKTSIVEAGTPITNVGAFLSVFADMTDSLDPYAANALVLMVGSLPSFMIPFFSRRLPLGNVLMNAYPITNMKRKFIEQDIVAITIKSGCPTVMGNAWCICNSIIYKGECSISLSYPKELDLPKAILKEFQLCEGAQIGASSSLASTNFDSIGKLMRNLKKGEEK